MSQLLDSIGGTLGALPAVMSPGVLIYVVIGLAVGIVWGAVPALSSTMAMALLIGFSAALGAESAIVFLLAIYSGSVFGGSISAICTNIPGTPAAACTALEGYPLFRRGEGGRAIGMAIASSSIGNLIGAVALVLFTPFLLDLALSVGPWEVFLLGVWGVVICGSVTSDEGVAKGWLSGLIGLALSFVGVDAISGQARFTYDVGFLYGGLSFVAVLIGVFGFAEIARGILTEEHIEQTPLSGRLSVSGKELRRNTGNLARSSILGAVIGAIPAAGADIAAYLSYSVAKRSARHEDRLAFGKGSYRGIVASESANNSSVGGSLLPLLVLAIPGSTVAAAFMGAMNLQGVQMGPMIAMNHPGLIDFIFAALIVISILMGVVAFAIGKLALAVLSIPRAILLPSILPICVLGAFAAQNAIADIYVMVAAGVAGVALSAARFPLAPIVMGIILGPLVDLNFRRAMIIFDDATVTEVLMRPIGSVLLVILLLTVISGFVSEVRDRRRVAALVSENPTGD